jgi:DNA topoisomerase-2
MHVFFNNEIKKYNSAEELLNDWFDFRYGFYLKRKESVLLKLEEQYNKLYYTLCFLKAVIDNTILINNRKKDLIINDLIEYEFPKINDSYDYLLNLPVYYFTKEKYTEYKENAKSKKLELTEYKKLEIKDI